MSWINRRGKSCTPRKTACFVTGSCISRRNRHCWTCLGRDPMRIERYITIHWILVSARMSSYWSPYRRRLMVIPCICKWEQTWKVLSVSLKIASVYSWSCRQQQTRDCVCHVTSGGRALSCCPTTYRYLAIALCAGNTRPISIRRSSNEVSSCSIHGKDRRWEYCNCSRNNNKSVIEWMQSRWVHATSGPRLI